MINRGSFFYKGRIHSWNWSCEESLVTSGNNKKLRINQKDVVIHCNNQSALNLMKNHIYHERTKQINAWMNFIQEIIAQGSIIMKKIWIKGNTTNMLTKVFLSEKFRLCQSLIGAVLEERKLVDRTWRFMTQVWSSLVKLK